MQSSGTYKTRKSASTRINLFGQPHPETFKMNFMVDDNVADEERLFILIRVC